MREETISVLHPEFRRVIKRSILFTWLVNFTFRPVPSISTGRKLRMPQRQTVVPASNLTPITWSLGQQASYYADKAIPPMYSQHNSYIYFVCVRNFFLLERVQTLFEVHMAS